MSRPRQEKETGWSVRRLYSTPSVRARRKMPSATRCASPDTRASPLAGMTVWGS